VIELIYFQRNVAGTMAVTSQAPVAGKIQLFQLLLMGWCNFYFPIQQPDFAFSAGAFATAGKFDTKFVQHINQRSLMIDCKFFSEWMKTDGMLKHGDQLLVAAKNNYYFRVQS
jgi:hypothetical protein